ncbi:3-oxoacyl-[acyl-carrier protein] reductase [Chondromyces apiculatus DSM 436]|uniref:3-oxoacyl-[acyl-carrier protein] reductase n=2 Tax=Chondromyces apiculatus TaxID=51 RepID=A0A017TEU0_9BACT|nr:3-oxoacyl-[acyl-carrier protein] reductase [Chondromyces apiculatus DSM 436]
MQGKVALITGASEGLGFAIARSFAEAGAKLGIASRRSQEGEVAAEMLRRETGAEVVFVAADVSQARDVERMVGQIAGHYGRLDHVCNNAGVVFPFKPITEVLEEEWDATVDINMKGVWLCMKYQIPELLKNGGGSIVNMSSVVGLVGYPNHYAYSASKAGIVALTKVAAMSYAQRGIRVNAVCPGVVKTTMLGVLTDADPLLAAQLDGLHPMNRLGTPEEVGNTVVWLCSEKASFITGHALPVDGGWACR